MGTHRSTNVPGHGGGGAGGVPAEHQTAAVLDSIRRIVRVLHVATGAAERSIGISAAQLFVLRKLAERAASSLNEVAARTYTHQSSVSVVVRRLVERGLVTRTRSALDGRRLELALTPAGRALLGRAPDSVQQRFVEALRRMPARTRTQLATTLGRLVADVGAAGEPPTMFFEDDDDPPRAARRKGKEVRAGAPERQPGRRVGRARAARPSPRKA